MSFPRNLLISKTSTWMRAGEQKVASSIQKHVVEATAKPPSPMRSRETSFIFEMSVSSADFIAAGFSSDPVMVSYYHYCFRFFHVDNAKTNKPFHLQNSLVFIFLRGNKIQPTLFIPAFDITAKFVIATI